MFKYDYKYAYSLDKLKNWEDFISHEFGYIIFRGWGKPPLPLHIFASDIPSIHMFYIALLSCAITYIHIISLNGKSLNKAHHHMTSRLGVK